MLIFSDQTKGKLSLLPRPNLKQIPDKQTIAEIEITNRSFNELLVTWHWNGDDSPVFDASQRHGLFAGKQLAVLGVVLELGQFAGDGLVFGDAGFEFA